MKFEIGHDLSIQGNRYLVLGSITYEDRLQGDRWEEYRLRNHQNKTESWLSYDEGNAEYEMSFMVKTSSPPEGFSLVDSGTQVVRSRAGNVDVDMGETAQYETWEDAEGAHTYSVERWSDEVEYSRGMYISRGDIQDLGPSPDAQKPKKSGRGCIVALIVGVALFVAGLVLIVELGITASQTDVGAALAGDSQYTLVNKESFDSQGEDDTVVVYATSMSVDEASKDVIGKVDGEVESVKEDEDNSTVAILTANEYVLVYQDAGKDAADEESEGAASKEAAKEDAASSAEKTPNTGFGENKDSEGSTANDASQSVAAYTIAAVTGDFASSSSQSASAVEDSTKATDTSVSTEGKTLVQVSTRHYAYTTDNRPYHSRYRAYRWYRAFYHGMGYAKDSKNYSDTESSYSKYNGETVTEGSSPSSYETYAKSLREESASTKKTSGGGTSGGK